MKRDRAVSPVIGTILMLAIAVILGSVVFVAANGMALEARDTNERPIPVSDNLLFNSGFEKGPNGVWEKGDDTGALETDAYILAEEPHFGARALKMNGTGEFTGQNVTESIESGYTYQLCAWSKVEDSSTTAAWVGVQYYDADETIIAKEAYEVTWTSYKEKCVLTEIGHEAGAQEAEVWIYRDTSAGDGPVYVDDVSLVQMRYFADPEADPNAPK